VNNTIERFPRASRDNPIRSVGCFAGPYRRARRWAWPVACFAAFAAIGIILAWRG
jgi:hypothetical protein